MKYLLLSLTLVLTACSNGARLGSGDIADAITTVEVIRNPNFTEIGTAPDQLGPIGGAVGLLAQKYVAKALLIEAGVPVDTANRSIDTIGWYWACQNLALFAGVEPVSRAVVGVTCAFVYWKETEDGEEAND